MSAGSPCGLLQTDLAQRVFLLSMWLLCTAMVFDLFDFATRTCALGLPAYWMVATGLVLGVLALAVALREVPLPIAWQKMHGSALTLCGRPLAILLFGASWALRRPEADIPLPSLGLSLLGAALAVATSWRGAGPPALSRLAERQPPCESERSPSAARRGLGEETLPPQTSARAH